MLNNKEETIDIYRYNYFLECDWRTGEGVYKEWFGTLKGLLSEIIVNWTRHKHNREHGVEG